MDRVSGAAWLGRCPGRHPGWSHPSVLGSERSGTRKAAGSREPEVALDALGSLATVYLQLALGVATWPRGWVAPGASRVPSASRIKSKFLPLLPTVTPSLERFQSHWAIDPSRCGSGVHFEALQPLHMLFSLLGMPFFLLKSWQILQHSSNAISKIPRRSSDTILSSLDPCPDWLHSGAHSSFVNNSIIAGVGSKLI